MRRKTLLGRDKVIESAAEKWDRMELRSGLDFKRSEDLPNLVLVQNHILHGDMLPSLAVKPFNCTEDFNMSDIAGTWTAEAE